MNSSVWLVVAAIAVGAAVPIQSAINAQMAAVQGHPLYGAIANTGVATLCLLVLIVTLRVPPPRLQAVVAAPLHLWVGGVIVSVRRRHLDSVGAHHQDAGPRGMRPPVATESC